MNGIFHWAYRYELAEWERLGWIPRPHILDGTHHGGRAVVVEWTGEGEPVRPARLEARQ